MSQDTAHGKPEFQLPHLPDGTSWTARENLHALLVDELLGPAEGERETLTVPPDTRYLLGRIAPTRLTADRGVEPETEADDDDSTLDLASPARATRSPTISAPRTPTPSPSTRPRCPRAAPATSRCSIMSRCASTRSWPVTGASSKSPCATTGSPHARSPRTPGCTRPNSSSTPTPGRSSCPSATPCSTTTATPTPSDGASPCSTATGWSSRSAAPVPSTGPTTTPPPAAPGRCAPPGCRSPTPRRPAPRRFPAPCST
jgi:hypothetical protein